MLETLLYDLNIHPFNIHLQNILNVNVILPEINTCIDLCIFLIF